MATRRRASGAWLFVLGALVVGVGLVAMHTEVTGSARHSHAVARTETVAGAEARAPACEGCASHTSMTMVCTVLLAAVGGGIAVRVVRRLVDAARLVHVAPGCGPVWTRSATSRVLRPPDLHVLQVMRC